ncbi:nucleotidyltransferase domain-containing protein [bacterium]|nr:nucleotidyltransferase domain-containing protein [bacterium]
MRKIHEIGEFIGQKFNPEKVILFGSHARGKACRDSDVDLLVVMSTEGKTVHEAVKIRLAIKTDFPVDIIVRTPSEVRNRIVLGDDFIKDIMENGIILYDSGSKSALESST